MKNRKNKAVILALCLTLISCTPYTASAYELTENSQVSLEELNTEVFRVEENGIYTAKEGYYIVCEKVSEDNYYLIGGMYGVEAKSIEEALDKFSLEDIKLEPNSHLTGIHKSNDSEYSLIYSEDGENFDIYNVDIPKIESSYKRPQLYSYVTIDSVTEDKVIYDFYAKYDTASFEENSGLETETGIYITDITARSYFGENDNSYLFGEFTDYDPDERTAYLHAKLEFNSNGIYTVVVGTINGYTCMYDVEIDSINKTEHIDLGDTTPPNITVDIPEEKVKGNSPVEIKVSMDKSGTLIIGTKSYVVEADEVVTYTVNYNKKIKIVATDNTENENTTVEEYEITNFEDSSEETPTKTGNRVFQDVNTNRRGNVAQQNLSKEVSAEKGIERTGSKLTTHPQTGNFSKGITLTAVVTTALASVGGALLYNKKRKEKNR